MITNLDPGRYYTDRSYLTEWFHRDTLVLNDNDIEDIDYSKKLLGDRKFVFDITHNPVPDLTCIFEETAELTLTNNFQYWYNPVPKRIFFPLFLWLFSSRRSVWTQYIPGFDAGSNKTQGIMCLNKQLRKHRIRLWKEFNRRGIIDSMVYTFQGKRTLPNETAETVAKYNDVGVSNPIYGQCAVNLVTETVFEMPYISEKTCKPFMARQIPILVARQGVNKFLSDTGLDMFPDLVPWRSWDNESDPSLRLQKIADFVEKWVRRGTILDDYYKVISRVEKNKKHFHSEAFRNTIMRQMNQLSI